MKMAKFSLQEECSYVARYSTEGKKINKDRRELDSN